MAGRVPPSPLRSLLRDGLIKLLCFNALLIGSASLAMDTNPGQTGLVSAKPLGVDASAGYAGLVAKDAR
jgi:hypothetical protein